MQVRCERDGTKWNAVPKKYPADKVQTRHECSKGDMVINCPTCYRGYFLQDDGTWECDRKLTVLKGD